MWLFDQALCQGMCGKARTKGMHRRTQTWDESWIPGSLQGAPWGLSGSKGALAKVPGYRPTNGCIGCAC